MNCSRLSNCGSNCIGIGVDQPDDDRDGLSPSRRKLIADIAARALASHPSLVSPENRENYSYSYDGLSVTQSGSLSTISTAAPLPYDEEDEEGSISASVTVNNSTSTQPRINKWSSPTPLVNSRVVTPPRPPPARAASAYSRVHVEVGNGRKSNGSINNKNDNDSKTTCASSTLESSLFFDYLGCLEYIMDPVTSGEICDGERHNRCIAGCCGGGENDDTLKIGISENNIGMSDDSEVGEELSLSEHSLHPNHQCEGNDDSFPSTYSFLERATSAGTELPFEDNDMVGTGRLGIAPMHSNNDTNNKSKDVPPNSKKFIQFALESSLFITESQQKKFDSPIDNPSRTKVVAVDNRQNNQSSMINTSKLKRFRDRKRNRLRTAFSNGESSLSSPSLSIDHDHIGSTNSASSPHQTCQTSSEPVTTYVPLDNKLATVATLKSFESEDTEICSIANANSRDCHSDIKSMQKQQQPVHGWSAAKLKQARMHRRKRNQLLRVSASS